MMLKFSNAMMQICCLLQVLAQLAVCKQCGLFAGNSTPEAYVYMCNSSSKQPYGIWKVQLDEQQWSIIENRLRLWYEANLVPSLKAIAAEVPAAQQQLLQWLPQLPAQQPQTQQQQQAPARYGQQPPSTPARPQQQQQQKLQSILGPEQVPHRCNLCLLVLLLLLLLWSTVYAIYLDQNLCSWYGGKARSMNLCDLPVPCCYLLLSTLLSTLVCCPASDSTLLNALLCKLVNKPRNNALEVCVSLLQVQVVSFAHKSATVVIKDLNSIRHALTAAEDRKSRSRRFM
jgi:hypothetical protein